MKNFDVYNYTISRHYAVTMVNADDSGLEPEDIELLDQFEKDLIERHGTAHIIIEPSEQETEFTQCDVSGLASDCYKVIVMIEKKGGEK
jgi:hypothetical protein